jgi:uncharacterized protein YneF (UPF0154 family)
MKPNLSDDHFLKRELDHLNAKMISITAPPTVEAALLKAFACQQKITNAAQHKRTTFGKIAEWFAPGVAIAASVSMSVWMLLSLSLDPAQGIPTDSIGNNDAPFIALQSLEQIALEPNPRLIETQVPKMMLASMGLSVSPETANESLRAEMLVSATGQPLALRFSPQ